MAFSKSFPKTSDKSVYPKWEEVSLSDAEENEIERQARIENLKLLAECIDDAKKIINDKQLKGFETSIVEIAIALFEKRASHTVFWKEQRAKEKFDKGK